MAQEIISLEGHPLADSAIRSVVEQMQIGGDANDKGADSVVFDFLPIDQPKAFEASGFCGLIRTKNNVIMCDTGCTDSYEGIKAFLNQNGVTKIDYLVISHYHPDHVNNIDNLVADFDFSACVLYLPKQLTNTMISGYDSISGMYNKFASMLNEKHYPDNLEKLEVDGVTLTFFNCSDSDIAYYNQSTSNYNDFSMCMYAQYGDTTVLYAGDVNLTAQRRITKYGYWKKVDILVCHHHGWDVDADNSYKKIVHPNEVIVPISDAFSLRTSENNSIVANRALEYWSGFADIYHLGYVGAVSFRADENSYNIVQNVRPLKFKVAKSTGTKRAIIYVDNSTTATKRDGTSEKPFKTITEALMLSEQYGQYRVDINVASGTYDESVVIDGTQSNLYLSGSDVVVTGSLSLYDCANTVSIKGFVFQGDSFIYRCSCVFFDGNNTFRGTGRVALEIRWSTVFVFDSALLTVDGEAESTSMLDGRGISIQQSKFACSGTLAISNRTVGVMAANGANVAIKTLSGENNDYVLHISHGASVYIYKSSAVGNTQNVYKGNTYFLLMGVYADA